MSGVNLTDFGFDFLQPIDLEEKHVPTPGEDFWGDGIDQPEPIENEVNESDVPIGVKVDPTVDPTTIKRAKITRKVTKKSKDKRRKPGKPGRPKKDAGKYDKVRPLKFQRPENGYASKEECRAFLLSFGFKTVGEMEKYIYENEIPPEIPARVKKFYGIEDMREFLMLPKLNEGILLPYEKARSLVQQAGIKTTIEYGEFRKAYNQGRTKHRLPCDLYSRYKDKFTTRDFFGLDVLTSSERSANIYPFKKARAFARTLGFSNIQQWREYTKSSSFPMYLPKWPEREYLEFAGFKDWLGYEDSIGNLLNNVQNSRTILGLFRDVHDDMYVYQIYNGGYASLTEFALDTGYELVRAYEFDIGKKKEWLQLVESHSTYHEMNMFTTFNVFGLLFDADALYTQITP